VGARIPIQGRGNLGAPSAMRRFVKILWPLVELPHHLLSNKSAKKSKKLQQVSLQHLLDSHGLTGLAGLTIQDSADLA